MRIDLLIVTMACLTLSARGLPAAESVGSRRPVETPPALRARQDATALTRRARPRVMRHWIFAPGRYTNDPETGKRVDQFEKIAPVTRVPNDLYYAPSGPHPYGPEYGYNHLYRLPGIAPIPYHLPSFRPMHRLPIGPVPYW
jgi:hypothetical protein